MNKILSKEISFELAKLLKEKGVKIGTEKILFYKDEINNIEEHQIKNRNLLYNADAQFILDENEYQVYTIGEVIDWLYEKYNLWIEVHGWINQPVGNQIWKNCFQSFINGDATDVSIFKTPLETYEYAIKYCLKQLIKNENN